MNFPCPSKVICPTVEFLGEDAPFANLSSEADDPIQYTVINFGNPQDPPTLGCGNASNTTIGVCSTTNPDLALICANNNQIVAQAAGRTCPAPVPDPPPPITGWPPPPAKPDAPVVENTFSQIPRINPLVFWNQAVGYDYKCPDGLVFTYIVEAGMFAAYDQATADAKARSYAQTQATKHRICMDDLTQNACWGNPYSSTADITGGKAPINLAIVAGALPPGYVMSQSVDSLSFTVSSTGFNKAAVGTYSFTVKASDAIGYFMQKQYTISVLGITNSTPAPITAGVPYSTTLIAAGGVPSYTFANTIGTPPAGLTLASNGVISGTPTGTLPVIHGVTVTDGTGRSCGVLLHWTLSTGPATPTCSSTFASPPWVFTSSSPGPPNSASGSGSGHNFNLAMHSTLGSGAVSADLNAVGIPYSMPAGDYDTLNCNITFDVTRAGFQNATIIIYENDSFGGRTQVFSWGGGSPTGHYTYSFPIYYSVTSIDVYVHVDGSGSGGVPSDTYATFNGTIGV